MSDSSTPDPVALLALAFEEAVRFQVKFAQREDPELQSIRKERWQAAAAKIQGMIDEAHARGQATAKPSKKKGA